MKGIITLCGSTRFKAAFERWNDYLTRQGYIVLAPGCFHHEWLHRPENNAELTKVGLDALHMEKIAMSDKIFVVDGECIVGKPGYVGPSTLAEMAYARREGVEVVFASAMNVSEEHP